MSASDIWLSPEGSARFLRRLAASVEKGARFPTNITVEPLTTPLTPQGGSSVEGHIFTFSFTYPPTQTTEES